MKVVILDEKSTESVLDIFVASGYDDFIVFSDLDVSYYSLNGIKITKLNCNLGDTSAQRLEKIKGSLTGRFFLVYSQTEGDLDSMVNFHREHQGILTLAHEKKVLSCAILEPEIFDYFDTSLSLEKEIFLKVAIDGEMQIYK